MEHLVHVAQAAVQRVQQLLGGHHQPLHDRREQNQRQGNPEHGVQDTERLARVREGGHPAVTWNSTALID